MSNKSKLRKEYLQIRENTSENQMQYSEEGLLSMVRFNSDLFQGRKISCYSSIGREMPTHSLLDLLIEIGSEIYLPKIIENSKVLKFYKLENRQSLKKNKLGIYEPPDTEEIAPAYLDIILLPCVCFDEKGYRIGMGKGYYDHSLVNLSYPKPDIFIVAHEFQKVEECFPEGHDIKADGCITETKFYKF